MRLRDRRDFLFLLMSGVICFDRFRNGLSPLQSYDDDFFYYLKPAMNLVDTGRATFDGVHLTNGYHPLWFLIVAVLYKLVAKRWFFVALQTLEFLMSSLTYFFLKSLYLRITIRRGLACAAAALAAVLGTALARGGMEIGVLFPLLAGALAYRLRTGFCWTNKQATIYGLLLSLAVLARLDAIFLAVLLLVAESGAGRRSRGGIRFASIVYVCLGAVLVPLYLLSNHSWFHVWMPVSGLAKQLQPHLRFSWRTFQSVFLIRSFVLQGMDWGAIALSVACWWTYWRDPAAAAWRRCGAALLVFPVVHFTAVALRSDWSIWPWYLYPFVLVYWAAPIFLLPLASRVEDVWLQRSAWGMYLLMALFAVAVAGPSRAQTQAFETNVRLAAWMHRRPGVYAMGDTSGMLSVMTDQRIVQTEGLMEDGHFLDAIRAEKPLAEVLGEYGATYYIAPKSTTDAACFPVTEPLEGGIRSAKMHATVCKAEDLRPTSTAEDFGVFPVKDVHRQSP